MALIKCYECGKEISEKAPFCPHCGAPQLVSKNKEVKAKMAFVFNKYLKPIGIGLGVIILPLAAVASVPLIQADGNVTSCKKKSCNIATKNRTNVKTTQYTDCQR